jgi:hypothetical protein
MLKGYYSNALYAFLTSAAKPIFPGGVFQMEPLKRARARRSIKVI